LDPLIKSHQITLIYQTHFDISSVRSGIEPERKLENVETRSKQRSVALIVVATPAPGGGGRFEARVDGHDRVLCVSRTPFFDAARELLAQGYNRCRSATRRNGARSSALRSCEDQSGKHKND